MMEFLTEFSHYLPGILFSLAGFSFLVSLGFFYGNYQISQWSKVQAKVTSADIVQKELYPDSTPSGSITVKTLNWVLEINYEFELNGNTYTSDSISKDIQNKVPVYHFKNAPPSYMVKALQDHPVGHQFEVSSNPNNPTSVYAYTTNKLPIKTLIISIILLILGGAAKSARTHYLGF